jgi:hypothetical protein
MILKQELRFHLSAGQNKVKISETSELLGENSFTKGEQPLFS